jgi:hypothetical protein
LVNFTFGCVGLFIGWKCKRVNAREGNAGV